MAIKSRCWNFQFFEFLEFTEYAMVRLVIALHQRNVLNCSWLWHFWKQWMSANEFKIKVCQKNPNFKGVLPFGLKINWSNQIKCLQERYFFRKFCLSWSKLWVELTVFLMFKYWYAGVLYAPYWYAPYCSLI